ncbi:MAG: tRNA pseudouridine(38-40) synthase TruA [Burkholderiales bacterium]
MRLALGLSYDGRSFAGWQSQPSGNTVQDCLEAALSQIAATPIRLIAAGRTDSGVHALGQVAHFDCTTIRPDSAWVRGTNALLPESIAVQWALPVAEEFNARFSALSRRYVYVLYLHAVRPSLLAGQVGWYHAPLDLAAMRIAAKCLIGQHDFSAFRSSQCQAKTPVRTISKVKIVETGPYCILDITADAFLHHMVRNIVGCLLYIGKGAHRAEWMTEILNGRDRRLAAPTIAPDGLYLAEVGYDARWNLPTFPRMMRWLDID